MMTKEELKPVMLAWLNEQTVQYRVSRNTEWLDSVPDTCLFTPAFEWRIKPEKKLRPWKLEEVPMCPMRVKGCKCWATPTQTGFFAVGFFNMEDGLALNISYEDLLMRYEHSVDGGKTWHPCGVEE